MSGMFSIENFTDANSNLLLQLNAINFSNEKD